MLPFNIYMTAVVHESLGIISAGEQVMGEWTLATIAFSPAHLIFRCHQRVCLPGLQNLKWQCGRVSVPRNALPR